MVVVHYFGEIVGYAMVEQMHGGGSDRWERVEG